MTQRSTPSRPPGRYGEPGPRRRLALTAAVVVVVGALLSWLLWAALVASTPAVRSTLIGFEIVDAGHVRVRFEVIADRAKAVTCTVTASDSSNETVGVTQVQVPPGPHDQRDVRTVVKTRDRAVTAIVAGCRVGGKD